MNLSDVYKIEEHAETAFVALLQSAVVLDPVGLLTIYRSRTVRVEETPRIEVKVIAGEPQRDHEYVFPTDPHFQVYDCYIGELQVTVTTNRTSDAAIPSHAAMLGKVRAALLKAIIAHAPVGQGKFKSPVLALLDCWEQGTLDSVEPDENLDSSKFSWFIMMQIKPSAWPENPTS